MQDVGNDGDRLNIAIELQPVMANPGRIGKVKPPFGYEPSRRDPVVSHGSGIHEFVQHFSGPAAAQAIVVVNGKYPITAAPPKTLTAHLGPHRIVRKESDLARKLFSDFERVVRRVVVNGDHELICKALQAFEQLGKCSAGVSGRAIPCGEVNRELHTPSAETLAAWSRRRISRLLDPWLKSKSTIER